MSNGVDTSDPLTDVKRFQETVNRHVTVAPCGVDTCAHAHDQGAPTFWKQFRHAEVAGSEKQLT